MSWAPGTETLFVLGLLIVVPAAIAKLVIGASWLQVACAFPLWFFCLWLMLGGPSVSRDEGIGWTIIISMFFGWLGVPLAALVLRVANLPYRFI